MLTKNSLIFIIEDDIPYGRLIQIQLNKQGFSNTMLFRDENTCLNNMEKSPEVIITDYHLNYMTGLKLIEKAKLIKKGIFTILLSGTYHLANFNDDLPMNNIDHFIQKEKNELQKLTDVLNNQLNPAYVNQFY